MVNDFRWITFWCDDDLLFSFKPFDHQSERHRNRYPKDEKNHEIENIHCHLQVLEGLLSTARFYLLVRSPSHQGSAAGPSPRTLLLITSLLFVPPLHFAFHACHMITVLATAGNVDPAPEIFGISLISTY